MTYAAGQVILDAEYNGFATGVNDLWGVGTSDKGYGQTNTISAVSPSVTITATQWADLIARQKSLADHQGTTITALTAPVATNTIAIFAAMASNNTTVTTNRLNVNGYGTQATNQARGVGVWFTNTIHESHYTFAGGDEARYFFNCGGRIRISYAKTSATSSAKNTQWNTLASDCGTYLINAQSSGKTGGAGSPTTNDTNKGYYDLTTGYTTLFKQLEGTTPYTANYIQVEGKVSAAHVDGRGNNGATITIKVTWQDDAADSVGFAKNIYNVLDQVDGNVDTNFDLEPPNTTYITNQWGTPTYGNDTNTQT